MSLFFVTTGTFSKEKSSSFSSFSFCLRSPPALLALFLQLIIFIFCCNAAASGPSPKNYHIGAVLSSIDHVNEFLKVIENINDDEDLHSLGIRLHGHSILKQRGSSSSAIEDTRNFCQNLMANEVSAVLIDDRQPAESITFTASLHNIPTIGLSNRQSIFSDKSLYGSYMRTASTYSHQADVWVELLTNLTFKCVHLVVSDSIDGRNIMTRFISLAEVTNEFDIESIVEFNWRRPELRPALERINEKNSSCRVFVLYADRSNAEQVLAQVLALNMSAAENVWLVSEQALAAPNLPVGFLGLRYKEGSAGNTGSTGSGGGGDQSSAVKDHITDSLAVIGRALEAMHRAGAVNRTGGWATPPPTDCRNLGRRKWAEGSLLYDYLRSTTLLYGRTGKVAFDERGDRLYGAYEILNQQYDRHDRINRAATTLVPVGLRHYDLRKMKSEIVLLTGGGAEQAAQQIIWPGNTTRQPAGYASPNHLKIVTLVEKPFVVAVPPLDRRGLCTDEQIPCPLTKRNPMTGEKIEEAACCEGYCIDLMRNLSKVMKFTYALYQVEDGRYGSYTYNAKARRHEWTGILGELHYGRADMAIAALTITPERSHAIDFTKPFKYQGITILQKRQSIHRTRHPLTSFLQPFQDSLWVSVFVAVHVVALSLYLLDRFSPFGRYKLPNCEAITEEDALNLSSAIWFAWGVLFNSGIGEGTPRSFSGRVVGMVWAGFAMIVVASYTANLAAFLVLDRPEQALTGINDPRLRNPKEDFNYSTVRDSSVENYFRRQVELAPMYKQMASINFDNAEAAIAAVKSGNLKAFIWDSARLEYEASKDCELSISGEHFGRSGYAIGLKKGQPYWKDKVTLELLSMHEAGFLEMLDNKWLLLDKKICLTKMENFPPTLGLKNMAGVFILVGTGIFGGVALIMFEIFYKSHQTKKQKRMELTRNAADKWKTMVENRKIVRASMHRVARMRYRDRGHQPSSAGGGGGGSSSRQQLGNSSSKSYNSEDNKSCSISSTETGPTTFHLSTESANINNNNNNGGSSSGGGGGSGNLRTSPGTFMSTSDLGNFVTYKEHPDTATTTTEVKKPVYLELKQTNAPAKESSMSTFNIGRSRGGGGGSDHGPHHHYVQEQHPRASSRIYQRQQQHPILQQQAAEAAGAVSPSSSTGSKPRLRREYSVAYEPSMDA